ncbi:MAG: F0F1 ATP synthase subunit B [bacterium]
MKRYSPRGSPAWWFYGAVGLVTMGGLTALAADGNASGGAVATTVFAMSKNMKIATEIVTHIIAFVLFILILRKLAWGPLLKVIDDRREKIESDFSRAEELQKEAEESRKRYETQLSEIEAQAREKIQESIDEGRKIAAEIQAKAREDAEKLLERAKKNAEIELANARKQLRKDVVELTLAATERVLREQIDKAAQARHIDKFIDEIGGLS